MRDDAQDRVISHASVIPRVVCSFFRVYVRAFHSSPSSFTAANAKNVSSSVVRPSW